MGDNTLMHEEDKDTRLFETRSAGETRELGKALADLLRPGDVLLLVGELGAGKTCLAKGLARGLGIKEKVLSPTFTLLREYQGRLPLYHLDAYRLEGPWDLFEIGVDEYLEGEGVLLVEWGDRARGFFTQDFLEIKMEFTQREGERNIHIISRSDSWRERLRELPEGRDIFDRE